MTIKRSHRDCGGEVINRRCLKCGKKFGIIKYFTTHNIVDKVDKFDPEAYRRRIRRGDDIS